LYGQAAIQAGEGALVATDDGRVSAYRRGQNKMARARE
jgi:hypothetical protein